MEENIGTCAKYFERMSKINCQLEIELVSSPAPCLPHAAGSTCC